jgi:hypothetical protein
MTLFFLVLGAIGGPLVILGIFFAAARLITITSGFPSLEKLYGSDASPPNATMATFRVGSLRDTSGSVGSDENGLFIHPGIVGRGVLIPWNQLQYVRSFLGVAWFRERKTRLRVSVPKSFVAKHLGATSSLSINEG